MNNFFGSVVGVQNALLAPLAPFGRKLSQHAQGQKAEDATFINTVGNTQTNPVSYAALPCVLHTASRGSVARNPCSGHCQGASWGHLLQCHAALMIPCLLPAARYNKRQQADVCSIVDATAEHTSV